MKHGCFNTPRQPGYWANAGFVDELGGYMQRTFVADTMTPDCQYAKGVPDDPKCDGCEKKGK